jgi:hypothetical protein
MDIIKITRPCSDQSQQVVYRDKEPKALNISPVFRPQVTSKQRCNSHGSMAALAEAIDAANVFVKINLITWLEDNDGYLYQLRSKEPELFKHLDQIGFFEFHRTNESKQRVYQHQVSKYLASGHKLYRNGYYAEKGKVEIHHLDGDTKNNDPRNLRYVSPGLNRLCAMAINLPYKGDVYSTKITESPKEARKLIELTFKRHLKRLNHTPSKGKRDCLITLDWNTVKKILDAWQAPKEMYQMLENTL